MTTPAAAALYEAQHNLAHEGKGWAIFNPDNRSLAELPIIYGFNNGGSSGWYHAQLLAEDGTALGSHICSSEAYMPHDLGILEGTRADRHETFRAHYPGGYRMVFISGQDVKTHPGLTAAYARNQQQAPKDV